MCDLHVTVLASVILNMNITHHDTLKVANDSLPQNVFGGNTTTSGKGKQTLSAMRVYCKPISNASAPSQ